MVRCSPSWARRESNPKLKHCIITHWNAPKYQLHFLVGPITNTMRRSSYFTPKVCREKKYGSPSLDQSFNITRPCHLLSGQPKWTQGTIIEMLWEISVYLRSERTPDRFPGISSSLQGILKSEVIKQRLAPLAQWSAVFSIVRCVYLNATFWLTFGRVKVVVLE